MILLDSSAVMRLASAESSLSRRIAEQLQLTAKSQLLVSRLAMLECRCKPMRLGLAKELADLSRFFNSQNVTLAEVTSEVIEQATILRATTPLRTPDAIHFATALVYKATTFATTDADFNNQPGIRVVLLPVR